MNICIPKRSNIPNNNVEQITHPSSIESQHKSVDLQLYG